MDNSELKHDTNTEVDIDVNLQSDAHAPSREDVGSEAELDKVVESFANCFNSAADDEKDDYSRTVSIDLAQDAADLHEIYRINASIGSILGWLAATAKPEDAAKLLAIKNDFYSGEPEDDAEWSYYGGFNPDVSWERLAELKLERRRIVSERARARAKLVGQPVSEGDREAAHWEHFQAERAAVDVEREIIAGLWTVHEAKWRAFVLERETLTPDVAAQRRTELLEEAEQIQTRDERAADNFYKLMCKVDRDWRKRELLQRAASYETTRGKENYQHEVV